jgi:hypothetical protein
MSSTINTKVQKKQAMLVPVEGLIYILKNIQGKIDAASGAATALDLRLRIIGQSEPEVQAVLKKNKKPPYHKAHLSDLIDAVLEVFQDRLDLEEQDKIKNCRLPRNKAVHGSFVELMLELSGDAPGLEIDTRTGRRKPLAENDIIGGVQSIEMNRGLEEFTKRANEAIKILEKILRFLKP